MSRPRCPRTADLLAVTRSSPPSASPECGAEYAAHLASCAECADALLVASFLAGEAAAAADQASLPDPVVVLWRARRRDRARAAKRALRPIAVWERLAGAVAAAVGAVTAVSVFGGFAESLPPLSVAVGELAGALPAVAIALLLTAAGGAVYLAWADD